MILSIYMDWSMSFPCFIVSYDGSSRPREFGREPCDDLYWDRTHCPTPVSHCPIMSKQ